MNLRRTYSSIFSRQGFGCYSQHQVNILGKAKPVFNMKRVTQKFVDQQQNVHDIVLR